MNTIAAGAGIHWNGIDGWLHLFAALAFLIAMFVDRGKPARWAGLTLFFIALGLLLWVLTTIITS
jgi:hypothetical protein